MTTPARPTPKVNVAALVTEIVEERQIIKHNMWFVDIVAKLLNLVSISDGYEEVGRRSEQLSAAVEDAQFKLAYVQRVTSQGKPS